MNSRTEQGEPGGELDTLQQKGTQEPDRTGSGGGLCSKHSGQGPEEGGPSAAPTGRGRSEASVLQGGLRTISPRAVGAP